jgi:hypothetical protein
MKAQAELLSLAIATALTILLVVAGIMWYATQSVDKMDITNNVAFLAAALPEWQCSYKGQTISSCIDIIRVTELGSNYFSSFGYSTLTLEYITQDWQKASVMIYDNKKERFVERDTIYVPVNVYDARTNNFLAGTIKVESYR